MKKENESSSVNNDLTLINSIELVRTSSNSTPVAESKSSKKLLFRDLDANTQPLIPYDEELFTGMIYEQYDQPKCSICTSPFRSLAEHVYLEKGRQPNSVVSFFENHFGAKLNWKQVDTHMQFHCDFRKVSTSGLEYYKNKEKQMSEYKYREYDFALTILLSEIDDIRGMTCNNADLKIRRTMLIDKLTDKILKLREKRDASASGMLNIFEVLYDVYNKMEYEKDKAIILSTVTELKEKIASN